MLSEGLTLELIAIQRRYDTATRDRIEAAIEGGLLLLKAKADAKHGDFLPMLKRASIPERKAQRWMNIASTGLKPDTVTDLGGMSKVAEAVVESRRRCLGFDDRDESYRVSFLRAVLARIHRRRGVGSAS